MRIPQYKITWPCKHRKAMVTVVHFLLCETLATPANVIHSER
jgi:hypothetical protein